MDHLHHFFLDLIENTTILLSHLLLLYCSLPLISDLVLGLTVCLETAQKALNL